MRKYRVTTSTGDIVIIEAENIRNAVDIARRKLGNLPNDVNTQISKNIISNINKSISKLEELSNKIKESVKELDWVSVRNTVKDIECVLSAHKTEIMNSLDKFLKVEGGNNA